MPRKPKCNICEIIKHTDLATNAKHQYQVMYSLKLVERARDKAAKIDIEKQHFCSIEHQLMAVDIAFKYNLLLERLKHFNANAKQRRIRELSELALKHAEAVIIHGAGSIEAKDTGAALERGKSLIDVMRLKRAPRLPKLQI